MDTEGLLLREGKRRNTALKILAELQLLERWRPYGEACLVGAAACGLLVVPDIDLEVFCPGEPRVEEGFAVLAACALHPAVRRARFSNHLDDEHQGLYWQLGYRDENGVDWKIDMWSMNRDHPGPLSRDLVLAMRRSLADETRAAILEIKENMAFQSVPACPSIVIYQAVMQGGVRTLNAFLDWRADHSEGGLTAWKPDDPLYPAQ